MQYDVTGCRVSKPIIISAATSAGSGDAKDPDLSVQNLKPFREAFNSRIIAAGGFQKQTAEEELNAGTADLVCFGRWYLANPDFPVSFSAPCPFDRKLHLCCKCM